MDEVLIIILLSAAGGAFIGALAVWYLKRSPKGSVAALEKKHEEFKAEVSDHFVKTAKLVNDMTHSYKAVYDHLREGARELLDQEDMQQRLAATEDSPVTLTLVGNRPQQAPSVPTAPKAGPSQPPKPTTFPSADPKDSADAQSSSNPKGAGPSKPLPGAVKPAPTQEDKKGG